MYNLLTKQFITDTEGNTDLNYVALDQTEKEVIDTHLFVEALAMICLDIAPSECSFPEAVSSLLQVYIWFTENGLVKWACDNTKTFGSN